MQNDLISRKIVMEYLQEQQANVIIEKHKNGFVSQEVCDGMLSAIDAFINFIVQCPIDYNVEKVVQQLEEEKMKNVLTIANTRDDKVYFAYGKVSNALDRAISVVCNGGKE